MVRQGECNGCGWCCQYEGVHRNAVHPPDGATSIPESDRKFYALRGGRPTADGKFMLYVMHAHLPCSAHDQVAKQCTDYEGRPDICREFPSTPEQIESTPCSFWFEDKGVKRGGLGSPYPTPPVFRID